MIKRLHDYQDDRYHRPHDNWIEVPVRTVTQDGELKTIQVRQRSLRQKRKIFTISCTAFTIGCLMIIFSSPYRNQFLAPGPLSSNHGQILAGQGADRCAACHGAANGSLTNWISRTFAIGESNGLSQSELCMKCHEQTLAMETALNPHNMLPDQLAQVTAKNKSAAFDIGMGFRPPVDDHNIACNACHREHHGSKHDLAALTDSQCQSCHQNTFHDFATDHPEFVNYAQQRRSKIAFDHTTHSLKHFPSKDSKFNCSQCHIDDSFQNVKQLASYEQACATCHDQQILESGLGGLALISLPMLDTEAIEAAKLQIGSWPMAATGDFDGPLPPIMRTLLSADPKAAEVLGRVGPEFDFADIDPTNVEQVGDAVELVWAIKRLLYDLSLDGKIAIRRRLETVMQIDVSEKELNSMAANLDEHVFQNAVRRWIPNLNVEVVVDRLGPTQSANNGSRQFLSDLAMQKSELSWWPSDEDPLLQIGKQDDILATNPIAGLIAPLNQPASTPVIPIVRVPDKQAGQPAQAPQQPSLEAELDSVRLKNSYTDPMNDPNLLSINPLQKVEVKNNPLAQEKLPKIVTPPPPQPGLVNAPPPTKPPPAVSNNNPVDKNVSAQKQSGFAIPGGWVRNDRYFRISYQPIGHADPCLKSWIELVTRTVDSDQRPETKPLFTKTISLTGIGSCRNCHTVDRLADHSLAVNWVSQYRDPSLRSFTRFAHGPHMIQPHLQDCSHCHALDPEATNHQFLHAADPTVVVSNFLPMKKANCSSCHQENQANSGCTQCHNYHIGSRITGVK